MTMDVGTRRTCVLGLLAICARVVHGTAQEALSITPSTQWYGVDGDWSAISLQLGTPSQDVDVMVSTVSSETWVGASTACQSGIEGFQCSSARGRLFDQRNSSTWQSFGDWSLQIDAQLGNEGSGEYGLDNIVFGSTGVTLPNSIIGVYNGTGNINQTLYQLGFFGLGVIPGNFPPHGATVPALNSLVETVGAVSSHSYGYTAGAKYRAAPVGTPNSLTLGGVDANRFVNHSISYALNAVGNPQVFVNSVTATSRNFSFPVQLLSQSDRVSAIIDSSTPYLWLPPSVCDRFAKNFGLVYNTTLNLYTFDGHDSQRTALMSSGLSFTFALTDITQQSQLVNITLPYDAFNMKLTFPAIPGTFVDSSDATKWYFPLRQAASEAQYTIGRVFLQEAYLITDYERYTFSVHQALFPTNPIGNTSIYTIPPAANSRFSGPNSTDSKSKSDIATGVIVGIVVSASAAITLAIFALWFMRRRKSQKHERSDDEKPTQIQQRSLLDRIRGRHTNTHSNFAEVDGNTKYATEVGADATHERFELPAPLGPAELDSESGTLDGSTQHGTHNSENLSAYERARRKLERQQIAAAHAQAHIDNYPVEKSENDPSHVAHYRAPDTPDSPGPLVSPIGTRGDFGQFGNLSVSSGSDSQPSPVSSGFDSSPISPVAPANPTGAPPSYRIRPENVVYAGRLPDNIQLPSIVPRIVGPNGHTINVEETMTTEAGDGGSGGTHSSLGSQYTEIEDAGMTDFYGSEDTNIVSPVVSGSSGSRGSGSANTNFISPVHSETTGSREGMSQSPRTGMPLREGLDPWSTHRRRLQSDDDLVHIPQPAENRFSWEEERISGNDSL